MLEVGSGGGELARLLAAAGYEIVAVDPVAPEGRIFRRTTIEDFDEPGPFDAVLAARSLHHVRELEPVLDKLAALAPLLVLDEFAWDRLDAATADWYERQRRALAAAGHEGAPALRDWEAEHEGLHGYETLRRELDARYGEVAFEWRPYLYRYLGGVSTEALEETLVETGAIQGLGFRYAGTVRKTSG